MEVSADLRWARAVVVALVATTLGAVAHVSAGGLLPGAGVLVAVAAVLVVLSAAALGHPASYVAIAVLVGGGQLLVHLVLTAASGHGGPHGASPVVTPPVPLTTPRSGGVRDALTAATGAPSPSSSAPAPVSLHWLDHLRDDITGANLLMSAVHLAAAAAVAWWLFVGERSLWALVALLGAGFARDGERGRLAGGLERG